MKRFISAIIAVPLLAISLAACEDDANIASKNLSKAADNFEIVRNIVFYNIWTDTEVATVVGRCSMEVGNTRLAVICKEGDGKFVKHYLGRSSNLSFFAIQQETADVSVMHTRITWKPQGFIPDVDFRGSIKELAPRVQ